MKQEALVSVVIVNWNGKKWLRKCLDSLALQDYEALEIIVVDNASRDGSIAFLNINYPNVIVVQSRNNLGFAGGNNLGIAAAKGAYIMLMNTDAWVEGSFVSKLKHFLEENSLDVVGPKEVDYLGHELNYADHRTIDLLGHPFFSKKRNHQVDFYLRGICILFKKDLYLTTKGLDNNFFMYFEETDWFWRLTLLGKKFAIDENLCVNHAGSGTAGRGIQIQTFLWRNQNELQMLLKNYAWYSLLWVAPIYVLINCLEMFVWILIFKPKIAWTYVQGWAFNIRNIRGILIERNWVQRHRSIGDREVMKKMHIGIGKLYHLRTYLTSRGAS